MNNQLIALVHQSNPWLKDSQRDIVNTEDLVARKQQDFLLDSSWDPLCLVLVGPRQVGKTTLGLQLCQQLIHQKKRFKQLLYLNCDQRLIREWLKDSLFLEQARDFLDIGEHSIIFIDEAQRLESPGLLLKSIIDLKLPIKLIASGSSQLEFKSKIQEHLTGRQIESLILPLSAQEYHLTEEQIIFGCYPAVVGAKQKAVLLDQLYRQYIKRDIVEILKVGKPDVMEKLIALVAHSSGQLVQYSQLATDCQVSIATVKNYLDVLENTYVLKKIMPFVGNKRKEITSNPIYYFIDNGFRNQALQNFHSLDQRQDAGLLVESFIFQTLMKYNIQNQLNFKINFWRTQSGAEVDFVLSKGEGFLPIEVKYRNMSKPTVQRGFRSFISAYQPKYAVVITKDYHAKIMVEKCQVEFIPINDLRRLFLVGLLQAGL